MSSHNPESEIDILAEVTTLTNNPTPVPTSVFNFTKVKSCFLKYWSLPKVIFYLRTFVIFLLDFTERSSKIERTIV